MSVQDELNRSMPAAKHGMVGDVLADLISQVNTLTTKHNALLAHLDTANVAGIGNANAASYGAPSAAIVDLESRRK